MNLILALALRRYTIRTRMLGAIAMVITLLVGVGGAGLWGLSQVSASHDRFIASTYTSTVVLAELRTAMGGVRRYEKDQLFNYDSAAQQAAYRPKWQGAVDAVRARARQLAHADAPAQHGAATQIDAGLAGYAALAAPVFKAVEMGGFNDAPVANKAIDPAKKLSHAAALQIDALAALMAAQTLSAVAEQQQARGLAERIAASDLSSPLATGGADETAGLLASLDTMQTSLRAIVGQVRESAQSIQVASAEAATGNTDLNQRTDQSASSLQQTAGSLEHLTGNVRQSADAASQANQLAVSASTEARHGGGVVAQVVSTMDEINGTSKRIADIIGAITAAAAEQSASIGTVNGAVIQLDQMTQQNAALVEESAAAAESLKAQAQRLADVVGRFQLCSDAPLATQTTPVPVARPTPRHGGAAPLVSTQVRPPVPRWTAPASAAPIKVAAVASVAVAASTESSDWESFLAAAQAPHRPAALA